MEISSEHSLISSRWEVKEVVRIQLLSGLLEVNVVVRIQ